MRYNNHVSLNCVCPILKWCGIRGCWCISWGTDRKRQDKNVPDGTNLAGTVKTQCAECNRRVSAAAVKRVIWVEVVVHRCRVSVTSARLVWSSGKKEDFWHNQHLSCLPLSRMSIWCKMRVKEGPWSSTNESNVTWKKKSGGGGVRRRKEGGGMGRKKKIGRK